MAVRLHRVPGDQLPNDAIWGVVLLTTETLLRIVLLAVIVFFAVGIVFSIVRSLVF
jgi:hypothetical protein